MVREMWSMLRWAMLKASQPSLPTWMREARRDLGYWANFQPCSGAWPARLTSTRLLITTICPISITCPSHLLQAGP